jgi:hypothetical protein
MHRVRTNGSAAGGHFDREFGDDARQTWCGILENADVACVGERVRVASRSVSD